MEKDLWKLPGILSAPLGIEGFSQPFRIRLRTELRGRLLSFHSNSAFGLRTDVNHSVEPHGAQADCSSPFIANEK